MNTDKNYYVELSKIDVGEHIEKKGRFSYLSWAWAVDQLRRVDPTATWEVIRFNGMPFMKTECGYFVEVAVTVNGITLSQIHPVLDNNNKPIAQPNAFQINTSIQRCLVKAIALHGLGLYIYAGEDLPFNDEEHEPTKKVGPITQQQVGKIKLMTEQLKSYGMSATDVKNCLELEIGAFDKLTSLDTERAEKSIEFMYKWVNQNQEAEKEEKGA